MDSQTRSKIDSAIETAAKLASEGMHPNDAIIKVAEENSFNADIGRLMARNFNVTKTLAHFEAFKGNAEKRASDFEVADAEVVAEEINKKAKVKSKKETKCAKIITDDNFMSNEVDEAAFLNKYCGSNKVASTEEVDLFTYEKYLLAKNGFTKKLASIKSQANQESMKAELNLAKLADTVRKSNEFKTHEADCINQFGEKSAKEIFDAVAAIVPFKTLSFTRASGPSTYVTKQATVSIVSELLDNLHNSNKLSEMHSKLAADAGGFVYDPEVSAGLSVGKNIGDSLAEASKSVSDLIKFHMPSSEKKTYSPADIRIDRSIEGDLEKAKASAVISEILADDEVLSQEDPELVARMASRQLELNPSLSNYPAVLSGAIRRAIATGGDIDSHEGKQLIHIDKQTK